MELAVADVERVYAAGAVLEEAIGETAGGGADVEADVAGGVEGEGVESGFEFVACAGDVAVGLNNLDVKVEWDAGAGFGVGEGLAADGVGEDEALGFLAGFGESTLDEELVEADFFWGFGGLGH